MQDDYLFGIVSGIAITIAFIVGCTAAFCKCMRG